MNKSDHFDIGFSFPGEHREKIRKLVGEIKQKNKNVNILFDEHLQQMVDLTDVPGFFDTLFGSKCTLVVQDMSSETLDSNGWNIENSAIQKFERKLPTNERIRIAYICLGDQIRPGFDLTKRGFLLKNPEESLADTLLSRLGEIQGRMGYESLSSPSAPSDWTYRIDRNKETKAVITACTNYFEVDCGAGVVIVWGGTDDQNPEKFKDRIFHSFKRRYCGQSMNVGMDSLVQKEMGFARFELSWPQSSANRSDAFKSMVLAGFKVNAVAELETRLPRPLGLESYSCVIYLTHTPFALTDLSRSQLRCYLTWCEEHLFPNLKGHHVIFSIQIKLDSNLKQRLRSYVFSLHYWRVARSLRNLKAIKLVRLPPLKSILKEDLVRFLREDESFKRTEVEARNQSRKIMKRTNGKYKAVVAEINSSLFVE